MVRPPVPEDDEPELSLDALGAAFAAALGNTAPDEAALAEGETTGSPSTLLQVEAAGRPSDDDEAACEISPLSILDALFFVGDAGGGPLAADRLAAAMRGVSAEEVHGLVEELNRRYAAAECPYEIADEGEGYRLRLLPEFARLREKFYGRVRQVRLSQAAVDVLSLVAYHEPIARDSVNRLRGRGSSSLLTQLVRRQLLRIERPDGAGKEPHYRTTGRFLDLFGLSSLADLPTAADLEQR